MQTDASLQNNRTRQQIENEIEEILNEADQTDNEEDEQYGPENRGDKLPKKLQEEQKRVEKLREAKKKLDKKEQELKKEQEEKIHQRREEEKETGKKKRRRKPTPPEDTELPEDTRANTTDPESQTMKTRNGWLQGYNGQAMVNYSNQVIVAQDITTDVNDVQQLEPMLQNCQEMNGEMPDEAALDAGYWSKDNAKLQTEDLELYIATKKEWKHRKKLKEKGPPRGRIPNHYGPRELMERKLRTKRGREIYGKRKTVVEPVFGQTVNRGINRFLLRGKTGAKAKWSLITATHNLLKLWRNNHKPATTPTPAK